VSHNLSCTKPLCGREFADREVARARSYETCSPSSLNVCFTPDSDRGVDMAPGSFSSNDMSTPMRRIRSGCCACAHGFAGYGGGRGAGGAGSPQSKRTRRPAAGASAMCQWRPATVHVAASFIANGLIRGLRVQ